MIKKCKILVLLALGFFCCLNGEKVVGGGLPECTYATNHWCLPGNCEHVLSGWCEKNKEKSNTGYLRCFREGIVGEQRIACARCCPR